MKFLVRYNAHIVDTKRPKDEGFPAVLVVNHIYDADTDEILGNLINHNYQEMINQPGITFYRDPTKIMSPGTGNVTNRFFIPWHMIAYVDVFVSPITEPKQDEAKIVPEGSGDIVPEVKGKPN